MSKTAIAFIYGALVALFFFFLTPMLGAWIGLYTPMDGRVIWAIALGFAAGMVVVQTRLGPVIACLWLAVYMVACGPALLVLPTALKVFWVGAGFAALILAPHLWSLRGLARSGKPAR